jgi:chloramphenicol O-acetyltransferase type A
MPRYLNIDTWQRKNQFHFFKTYDIPFFGLCSEVDITKLHRHVKDHRSSFFFASLFLTLKAAHDIEEFHYRLRGDRVVIHDRLMAGSTVLNQDKTFSFCYFEFFPEFNDFHSNAEAVLRRHAKTGNPWEDRDQRDDMIHYSVIPWIRFTSLNHARKFDKGDSIPKIVMGKYSIGKDAIWMPLSVEVHHALMDGYHLGQYFSTLQEYLNNAGNILV